MLVVSRFRYAEEDLERARAELASCAAELSRRPGFVSGSVGRALDDPTLWLLTTSWRDVGSYRRALSSYEVKAQVVPLLSAAIDEPSAYEVLAQEGADAPEGGGRAPSTEPNEAKPRGTA